MKKYFLVFLFLVTCTLPGCYRSGSVGANRRQDAAAVVNRVVPICSITNSDAVKFDECSVLERDTYGRKLCCYKTYSSLFREQVEVLLVIQKTSGDDVFYYPNDCYLLHFKVDMDFSDAEIQGLKDRNDWELPLVTEALCSVPYQGEGEAPDQIVYTIDRYSMQEYDKKIIKKYCLNEKVCVFWRSEATSYHAVCVGFRTSHTLVHILSGRRMQKSLL